MFWVNSSWYILYIYDKTPVLEPYRGTKDWRTLQEKKEYAEDYEKYCSKSVTHRNWNFSNIALVISDYLNQIFSVSSLSCGHIKQPEWSIRIHSGVCHSC
jgi:hypothetical protein